ncbi:zinc finger, CCHC-type containing protein [Tanacetum coccineum]
MGDENPIRTLGDYSKPSHEGYRNTIDLPAGTDVVPLRSDTIRLVQNGCSFHGIWSEDPNQHLKDFLKLVDSHDLDGSISTWEDLTTRFLAQFFPPRRTAKLRNDILMFQQHHGESLSEAWTRFKDLLQKVPHHGIDRWLQIQIFYNHVSFHLKCEIDRATGGKLRNKNTDESWEIIKNLGLYNHEGLSPQPQALDTTFEARVWDYMAAHTERMERFENTIFKQREEINGRMTEMFGLLKELTTSKTPEKVLIREEAKFPVTKNVNSISLTKGEEGGSNRTKVTPDNAEKLTETETETPVMEVKKINEVENGAENKSIKTSESEEAEEAPSSQPVAYYLKHKINEKLIKGENENRPFILGTPFLTTAKASIKFDTGTITLRSGKHKVSFHRIPDSSNVTDKGVKNDIEPIAPTMTVNRLVLEWEEKIKLHLEREMQFNQWRSKNFKGMHPTLIATKEGMDDEGEVT